MPSIYGRQPMPLKGRFITADTTLKGYDLKGSYNVVVLTGSVAKTLTLPTPVKDLCSYPIKVYNNSTAALTLACSLGMCGGGSAVSSVVLDAGASADVRVIPATSGTYLWEVSGASGPVTTGLAETIADVIGAMVSGNTETGIAVAYQDADNTLDFTLSDEYIQDVVGAMFTGNTETGITAEYQDGDGTIDLTVTAASGFDYVKTGLTGGTASDLDGIDGAGLVDGDTALVVVGNAPGIAYIYVLDDDGGAGESSPGVIVPDTNPGTLNWVLASIKTLSTDVTDWQEAVEDTVGALIGTASTHKGNTATYTDGSGTLSIDSDSFQFTATALTGGGAGALDLIDGDLLSDGDVALTVVGNAPGVCYIHVLDADGAAGESSPGVVVPDTNPGTKNWVLASVYTLSTGIADWAEAVQDTAGAMFTGNTETGVTCTYQDDDGTIDVEVTYGTSAATACVGNDARLPVDWTTWSPSVVWTGGAPASVTQVARYCQVNDTVHFVYDILSADGDGKIPVSISPPVAPADINALVPMKGLQTVDGTTTDAEAYLDQEDNTEGNRLIKFYGAATWTDGTACRLHVSGSYEV